MIVLFDVYGWHFLTDHWEKSFAMEPSIGIVKYGGNFFRFEICEAAMKRD
ncbi:MAG: hypothetical protein ACPGIA_05720 [Luteolibacter sp.]